MTLLLLLQRRFLRRFLDGKPGPWGALAAGIFGFRTLWRWSRRSDDVAYRAELKPGETVTISHTTDTEVSVKRDRRRAKRTDRKAKRVERKQRRRGGSTAASSAS